jgi:Flp pilus assembly protein protease CpaA
MFTTMPVQLEASARQAEPGQVAPKKNWRRKAWLAAFLIPLILGPFWCWGMWGLLFPRAASFSGLILLLMLSVSTVTDIRRRKIYNWATYSASLWLISINGIASVANWLTQESLETEAAQQAPHWITWVERLGAVGIGPSLAGGAACFFVLLMAYQLARGGAGDVKLATALGLAFGVRYGLLAVGLSYIAAGAVILVWTIKVRGPLVLCSALLRKAGSLLLPVWIAPPEAEQTKLLEKPIPLAPFFAIGTLIVLLEIPL